MSWLRPGRPLIPRNCSGLSSGLDQLVTAAVDTSKRFRAFGVTAAGDLVTLIIPVGKQTGPCRVSSVCKGGAGSLRCGMA
jgi:hypothetical protein